MTVMTTAINTFMREYWYRRYYFLAVLQSIISNHLRSTFKNPADSDGPDFDSGSIHGPIGPRSVELPLWHGLMV